MMYTVRNILFINLLLLICSSLVCSFPSSEGKNDKPKEEDSDSAEGKKKETESLKENDKSKEETESPKEVDKSEEENESPDESENPKEEKDESEKEEKDKDEEKPAEENEEDVTADSDDEDLKMLDNFFELVDKEKSESSDIEEKEMSPAEIKKIKEETFSEANKNLEKEGLPEISREKFDKIWDKMQEKHGDKFPIIMERVIHRGKTSEEDEEGEKSETSLEVSTESSETEVDKDTFVVRNAEGKVCILAKFHYTIKITYLGKIPDEEEEQTMYINTNRPGKTSGNCAGPNEPPTLHRSWDNLVFTLTFDKTSEDTWGVTSVQLTYDTSDFVDPVNPGKVVAKTKSGKWFDTPFKRSYYCPAEEVFSLYSKNKHVVTVGMKNVHLQPYDVEGEKFSESYRCDKVVIDEEPFVRDETVPLAVGCTLALITLLILVGFSVHRAYYAAKVDYNTVE